MQNPAPKSSSRVVWVLVGLGILFVLGGVAALIGLVAFGSNVFAEEVCLAFRDHRQVREQLGELKECSILYAKSGAAKEADRFFFRVKGAQGTGELDVRSETGDDGNEIFHAATLRVQDRVIELELHDAAVANDSEADQP